MKTRSPGKAEQPVSVQLSDLRRGARERARRAESGHPRDRHRTGELDPQPPFAITPMDARGDQETDVHFFGDKRRLTSVSFSPLH
jgi:hypothetical protein